MATPTSWAQEVITCDLCPKPTQQFCNNCQVSLCVDCVSKHVDKFKSQTHDIVHFTNRKIQPVFPECTIHSNQRCEAHCRQCDVHVCLKCILSSHSGHNIVEIQEIFKEKKKEIVKENQEIESTIIPNYKKKMNDIGIKISTTTAKFDELEKETEKHRKLWHQEVDNIFNKLDSLIKSMKENYLTPLKSHQSKLKNLIPDMIQTVEQNKEILKTNRVSEVNNYKSKLKEYRDIPADIDVKIPSLNAKTVKGRELDIELGEYKATLTQKTSSSLTDEVSHLTVRELLKKAKVITTILTGVKPLWRVACVRTDEAWVGGTDKVIRRVDKQGSVQESVITRCLSSPSDISVTVEGELVYSDSLYKTVYIVRQGRTEVMITTPRGWTPYRLCCTRSGDILVSMSNEQENKIIRYQGAIIKQEIHKDEHRNLIFKEGLYSLYMTENNNGDICVSDRNAKIVVVVDKTGRIRFQYDGTAARREKPFSPGRIVTDSLSQIIVTDYNNDCLHILDQNGQLLRCVDNFGLDKPSGLSVDIAGRLWVGLFDSGEVKVIQYMK
ncbi:E3 ubiquitin-protein ligase TRIM71-like [Saccostrea echinata]|uniref:E3 ubiquitin-protein ligase TRIM71-like n=1 Tax=Saccostrea echinata TaxID=191078 RepID=UPI002A835E20|nr:E3 ubiquitin-protein ligase TRIM71-like [Saccostrea echinata]